MTNLICRLWLSLGHYVTLHGRAISISINAQWIGPLSTCAKYRCGSKFFLLGVGAYWPNQWQKCCVNSFFFWCGHSGPPIGGNAVGIVQKQNNGVRVNAKATAVNKKFCFVLLVPTFFSFQNWIPDIFSEGGILTVQICN